MSGRAAPRGFLRNEAATTAVEFAVVAPVFLGLVFAIFQFGLAQHHVTTFRHALNKVARSVMLDPALTQAEVSRRVKAELGPTIAPKVTVTMADVTSSSGDVTRLTGTYAGYVGVPTVATYPLNFTTTVDATRPDI